MKHKPIKRSVEIVSLSQEHHYSLLFAWKVNQGLVKDIATGRIVRYVNHFWNNHLRPHFEQEQKALFPLREDNALVQSIWEEQKEMVSYFQYFTEENHPEEEVKEKLQNLANLVKDMVRKEERELFPDLENQLTSEEMQLVAEKIRAMQPEHLKDDYDDEFWDKGIEN